MEKQIEKELEKNISDTKRFWREIQVFIKHVYCSRIAVVFYMLNYKIFTISDVM